MTSMTSEPSQERSTNEDLGRMAVNRKVGTERFLVSGDDAGFDLLAFWQWSTSDLISNATRGVLAEFIVARALGIGASDVRAEWAAHDLTTPDGIKIEVKSAAYVQTWFQKRLSVISFDVRKTLKWDPETNRQGIERERTADVYVFALFTPKEKTTANPLELDQWKFYAVPTEWLNQRKRSQHSITLASLQRVFGDACSYTVLAESVRAAKERHDEMGRT